VRSSNSTFAIRIRWKVWRMSSLMKYFVLLKWINVFSISDSQYLFFELIDWVFCNRHKIATIRSSFSWTSLMMQRMIDLRQWNSFSSCFQNIFLRFSILLRIFYTTKYNRIWRFFSKRSYDRKICAKRTCWMLFYRKRQEIHNIQKIRHLLSRCLTCCAFRDAFLRLSTWQRTDLHSFFCSSCWTLMFLSSRCSSRAAISN
jgi:hypothetical protein